jgi:hypothetical protein
VRQRGLPAAVFGEAPAALGLETQRSGATSHSRVLLAAPLSMRLRIGALDVSHCAGAAPAAGPA